MRVTTSSGCTARHDDSKSKSAGAAAYRSSTEQRAFRRAVDADDVVDGCAAGSDAVDVLLFADRHLGTRIAEHVGQLLGRQRVVHRKRRGTNVLGADLERVELDPVRHHQRDGVAAPNPEARQPGSNLAHLIGIFAPGQCLGVTRCPQHNGIRIDRRGALERLAHGGRALAGGHGRSPWFAHISVSVRPRSCGAEGRGDRERRAA